MVSIYSTQKQTNKKTWHGNSVNNFARGTRILNSNRGKVQLQEVRWRAVKGLPQIKKEGGRAPVTGGSLTCKTF